MLSGNAAIAAVIGDPVTHSLSPRLHNYWLKTHQIDGVYIPLSVKADDFETVIHALPKMGFRGFNLTIPYKELIIPYLDSIDDDARIIGAVNTVIINEDGKLHGKNSDVYGFVENIKPHLHSKREKAVVLGAGGAAKAVCQGLIQQGFTNIIVVNRTIDRAQSLASQLGGPITVERWEDRSSLLSGCDLLVNTTSLGLVNQAPLELSLDAIPVEALVTDIVYTPLDTPLLLAAQKQGNQTVDGLGMLLHQAVTGFESWFDVMPNVTDGLRQYILSDSEPKA